MGSYSVKQGSFEGPLELLADLIEKEKLDISDVSLARITDEFLGYLEHFERKDPAHLADFLVIAAKLILMKSKTLLPLFNVTREEEQELTEFKDKLAEYQKVREGAKRLAMLERKRHISYHRSSALGTVRVFLPPSGVDGAVLRAVFSELRKQNETMLHAIEERSVAFIVSFEDKVKDIRMRLETGIQETFSAMYDASEKINIIIAFLAVLELVKQRFLDAHQEALFGEIALTKTSRS